MVGFFDSGVGGLTVLRSVLARQPQLDFVYLGDTLHNPFGGRTQEQIYNFTRAGVEFLATKGCKKIVIACNTASSKALPRLQQEFAGRLELFGVIKPVAQYVARHSKHGRVGVIATRSTIESGAYEVGILAENPALQVFSKAAPLLVPLVEEGFKTRKETRSIIRYYLRALRQKQVDTIVLGCTHYPFLLETIRDVAGKQVDVPNPPDIIADVLLGHLEGESMLSEQSFYATDDIEGFNQKASAWLGSAVQGELVQL
jgi:glutamate racemase